MLLNTIHILRCVGSDIVMGIFTTSEKHGNQLFHQVCIKSSELKKKKWGKSSEKNSNSTVIQIMQYDIAF